MSLKTILVHLDHTVRSTQRLDLAIALASKHQAHLSGFFVTGNPEYNISATAGEFSAVKMQALFQQKTAQAGISADWIDGSKTDPLTIPNVDKLILHTYYADLVVVGQLETGSGSLGLPADFPERIAMFSGRPVLVIPRRGEFSSLGERVMVTWHGGRLSSRALHDAIPVLCKAQHVDLVMVNPAGTFLIEAENLRSYLAHNAIVATWNRVVAEELSTGNVLLNQACDLGADLLVLGIFSHSRTGRIRLGPVGRHLLDFMTVPVLISG